MQKHHWLAVLLVQFLMSSLATAEPSEAYQPVFTPDGRIVCGSKGIWQKNRYGKMILKIDGDALGQYFEMFNLGKEELSAVFFMNKENTVVGKSSIFTADIRDAISSDVKLGTYKFSMTLLSNNLIKVESVCKLDDPSQLKTRYSVFDLPSYLKLTGEHLRNGKRTKFDDSSLTVFRGDDLKSAKINFFPENDARSFSIIPLNLSEIIIRDGRVSMRPSGQGAMSFLLDIRGQHKSNEATELSPNGIDFWNVDRLHLPDYEAEGNLIMNPSFEAGLRYWGFPIYVHSAIPLKYTNVYELDDQVAHSGSHSLRIKALPVRCPSSLGPFAVPFVPGETYTYSFYAKRSVGKPAVLNVWGRGQNPQLFPDNVHVIAISEEWQRYTLTFVAKERFSSIFFDAKASDGNDDEDAYVWIDDIQLEKGEASDFTQPPIAAQLVSNARGNFLEFGQQPDFKLNICSQPNMQGEVAISIEDFFFKTIFEDSYQFTTDDSGQAEIDLSKLGRQIISSKQRGVFMVAAKFTGENLTEPFKDYFRFSVMNFLDNTHKNKNMFNLTYVYSLQAGGPLMERFMERERAIGFGSICYDFIKFANDLDYDLDRERMELVEKYGFAYMGRPVLKLHDGEGGEISELMGEVKMQGVKNRINPTDEELAEFQAIVELKARNRPWNKIWWFTGESNPGVMPLESHPDAFAKFLLATYHGVKKGNPEAQVLIEGGPWTMETKYGAKWVERYIQDTKRLDPSAEFFGAAAHHYRNFPEKPDLDTDIKAFLEMLDRNGHSDWPFYVNEGGNYIPFNIPQEGISPYVVHSGNAWYIGPLSYAVGQAERISAAFSARNWLIGLKYADRVACMQDFNTPNRYVDIDFTPRPYEKIPNTLGRLLGNSTFYKDIRFSSDSRCYVFEDDKTGEIVAAIWGHKESVDRWKEDPPLYQFDFQGIDVRFIDLMENEIEFFQDDVDMTIIPMSPFPIFIKASSEEAAALCQAIESATASDAVQSVLDVTAIPIGADQASVILHNGVSKPYKNTVDLVINDSLTTLPVEISELKRVQHVLPIAQATDSQSALRQFDFTCNIDGEPVHHLSHPYLPVYSISSGEQEWSAVPSVELRPGLTMKIQVVEDELNICLESLGNQVSATEQFAGLGIYIDPFAKVTDWYKPKAAKQDLAVFELQASPFDELEAMCHYVQGTQAGSGTDLLIAGKVQKAIKIDVLDNDSSAKIVLTIPKEVVAPLSLKPGDRFGFNLSLPSDTGNVSTLAEITNYQSSREPGLLNMVLVLVCE